MESLNKARIETPLPGAEEIPVLYNPAELSFDKSVQISEINIPGLDSPILQFVRGQNEKLTMDLFFDTTDQGMDENVISVTTETDKIYSLLKIIPDRHAPPICTFTWHDEFPGNHIFESLGNQKRNSFRFVLESIKQKFTLFSPEGVPLRATLSVVMREYKTLHDQLKQLNLSSPDRTHSHVLRQGETLSSVAHTYYNQPEEWRHIARKNGIEDPRRLSPGLLLTVPPTTEELEQ